MAKVLARHLTDLRYDLKDPGALWSDAELTRCLEKSTADLSRFLPREKILELTFDFTVIAESFTTPAAIDTDYYVTTKDISVSVDGATCTLVRGKPDVPRPVTITVTDANASISQLVIIVKGTDVDGRYMEEFFYLAGGLVQTGDKYFATVSEIEIEKIAGNGAADTLIVGTGLPVEVYMQLASKPIKQGSEAITGYTRDTDYIMDYASGRIAMKSGGSMTAGVAYAISYTKSQISIDLAEIADDLIRVDRLEYPAGGIPQLHHTFEMWGNILTLSGGVDSQAEASDDEHLVMQYLASHSPPSSSAPGSYPSFLDPTVQLAASAYALFMMALKYEHQAVTDIAYVDDALDKVALYLETNGTTDNAQDVLANITDDAADLRAAIVLAVEAASVHLGAVSTTSLDKATTGAEAYLDTGDGVIPTVNAADDVSRRYSDYTRARVEIANARVQAAIGYIQEAVTRLQNLESYISEAGGWMKIAEDFIAEASGRIQNTQNYLAIAEVFRNEAIERRNEAWAIWSSPNQIAPMYQLNAKRQTVSS